MIAPPYFFTEPDASSWSVLKQYVDSAGRITLLCHKSPDGDTIGAALALFHLLSVHHSKVDLVVSGEIPSNLRFLPGCDRFLLEGKDDGEIDTSFAEADLFLSVDFNTPSRVGMALIGRWHAALAAHPRPMLMIDHHPDPAVDQFDFLLHNAEAAATCELIANLLIHNSPELITSQIATCLLTGIITDTGLFNHACSHASLFRTVADLMDLGADKGLILNSVFHSQSEGRMRLEGFILHEKLQLCPKFHLAYFTLSKEEMDLFGVTSGDTEGLVNIPLDIASIDISAFVRESPDEGIKISLRSKGNTPVNTISAACYGGGGHRNAAGGEMQGSLQEAIDRLLAYMEQHYPNLEP